MHFRHYTCFGECWVNRSCNRLAFFSHRADISTSLLCFCREDKFKTCLGHTKNKTFTIKEFQSQVSMPLCESHPTWHEVFCFNAFNLNHMVHQSRLKHQVTFRAAFIAVTAALQRERAWVWSPLQSAWRTHRKSTLAGRPGGRDRALSTRMSGVQTERAAMAKWTRSCLSLVLWFILRDKG